MKLQAGTFRREPRGILPRGCLVTPQGTPRLVAEWSLEHVYHGIMLFPVAHVSSELCEYVTQDEGLVL